LERVRVPFVLLALLAATFVPGPASAAVPRDAKVVREGLARAVERSRLDAEEAARYRAILDRAVSVQRRLPNPRASSLAAVIRDVSAQVARYDRPRSLALFSMLDLNTRHLGSRAVPPGGTDVQDAEGVVYRAFAGRGLQFHPLANFAKLNSLVAARRAEEASRLAQALVARGVPAAGGLAWEYYFPFGGGKAPWTSGMAQAVAAQALARAGLLAEAGLAFRSVERGLVMQVDGREWVRIYSFNRLAVLNAQLQALLSVRDYAELAEDPAAADLSARLEAATASLLPGFDTGAWSLYALRGAEAALGYHTYVVSLLKRLALRSQDPLWRAAADRFDGYMRQPPVVVPAASAFPALYPDPRDGFRDELRIVLTLSKLGTVTVDVGGVRRSTWLTRGRRTVVWRPGRLAPGTYPARLRAVDPAGNAADVELPAVQIRRDTTPPELAGGRLRAGVLTWSARDAESPWLRVRVELRGAKGARTLDLGRRAQSGSASVRVPRGWWGATLAVTDSSGNASRMPLGLAIGR
jgi:hypothetical protein